MKRLLKQLFLLAVLPSLMLLSACSSDSSGDALALLQTVPSDAGVVMVINGKHIVESAGGKLKDGAPQWPAESRDSFGNALEDDLFTPESGVDCTTLVAFTEGYFYYLTGTLSDAAKFESYCESKGEKLETQSGLKVSHKAAVAGNQFWVAVSSPALDALTLKGFTELSNAQSWASKDYAEKLAASQAAISMAADLNALLRLASAGGFKDMATVRLAVSGVFKDATYLLGDVAFLKGKMELKAKVADSRFKPAEFLLPLEEIDFKTVEALNCTAEGIGAAGVPAKLIKAVGKLLPGGMPAMYAEMLAPIDGTVALAKGAGEACSAVVQTNGKSTSQLSEALQGFLPGAAASSEGKLLMLRSKSLSGPIDSKEAAQALKGAVAGVVVSMEQSPFPVASKADVPMKVEAMLRKEGSGLQLSVALYSSKPKENFLRTMLADAKK